jgi:C1A family cysteine protease
MSQSLNSRLPAKFRQKLLLSGGVLLLLVIGLSAAFWLTEQIQDPRQQASMLSELQETNEVKALAGQKGIQLSDSEASTLSKEIQTIKADASWQAGVTSLAVNKLRNPDFSPLTQDVITPDEVKAALASNTLGSKKPTGDLRASGKPGILTAATTALGAQLDTGSTLPTSYDWRTAHGANFLTPVRDQGLCGSCWAFTGNATLEGATAAYFNQPNQKFDLSEQNLLSCSSNTTGCVGTKALIDDYYLYAQGQGVVTESCMAYQACDPTTSSCSCPASNARCSTNQAANLYKATYGVVPSVWINQDDLILDAYATANNMKRAIIEHGPISTGLYIFSDFELYTGGVYRRTAGSTFAGGHATTIIGWGEENGQAYWLFKNSWSPSWGENGFGKYKMMGAHPGDTLDLYQILTTYTNVGGPDPGFEGIGAAYDLVANKPALVYIDTPQPPANSFSRACTDRDNDSYCYWGMGSTKPASGCPASCASQTKPDCDDGRNTLGSNCQTLAGTVVPTATPTLPTPTATTAPSPTPTTAAITPLKVESFCSSNTPGPITTLNASQCANPSAYQFNFPLSEAGSTACETTRVQFCGQTGASTNFDVTAPTTGEVIVYYNAPAGVTAKLKIGTTNKTHTTSTTGEWHTGATVTAGQKLNFVVDMGEPPLLGWVNPTGSACKGFNRGNSGGSNANLDTAASADQATVISKQCWGDGSTFEAGGPGSSAVSLTYATSGNIRTVTCDGSTKNCRQAYFSDMDFNDGAFWVAILPSAPAPTATTAPNPTATAAPTPTGSSVPSPTSIPRSAADFNSDGKVDMADYGILLTNYGQIPPSNALTDLNKDGIVNAIDYAYFVDFLISST